MQIANVGTDSGDFEMFSQTGGSPKIPPAQLPQPGDNFAVADLRASGARYLPAAEFGDD